MSQGFNRQDLPGLLGEIAELTCVETAMRVAKVKGGGFAYFPAPENLTGDHWLVQAAGMVGAQRICERLSGSNLEVPLGPLSTRAKTWRMIRSGIEQGLSSSRIARYAGVHRQTVLRHKRGESGQAVMSEDQMKLFD
jgi:hypothetical protein